MRSVLKILALIFAVAIITPGCFFHKHRGGGPHDGPNNPPPREHHP